MTQQTTGACQSPVFFVRGDQRREGRILLNAPKVGEDGCFTTSVVFEGIDIDPVVGSGDSELAAAKDALRRCSAALEAFRASGGDVLQPAGLTFPDSELVLFPSVLEDWARPVLRQRFGEPEPPPEGKVVQGPLPDASGYVNFTVVIGDAQIPGFANQNGLGVACADREKTNAAMRVLSRFLGAHDRHERLAWFRESARMRREAGAPPDIQPRHRRESELPENRTVGPAS